MLTIAEPVKTECLQFELPEMNDEQFARFCALNRDLRIERTAGGVILIMAPAYSISGFHNGELTSQLFLWSRADGTGVAFDSSAGFRLPNSAILSPDAAWISRARLERLSPEDRCGFLPLCPDFVAELRSSTDRLSRLQAKMEEFRDQGARLGWLIDSEEQRVYVYRPGEAVEIHERPETLSGDPVLPGLVLNLARIWSPDW
jgi:Uma2 family endonuclease